MATPFLRFWANDQTRERTLSFIPQADLPAFRLVCYDFATRTAPHLFKELTITFRASTFTKPARLAALARIGYHAKTVHFKMAHSPDTFLPPLISRFDGQEVEFIYEPYCQINRNSDRVSTPTYGSWEVTELLIQQYPPLFHAAANVPTFLKAFSLLSEITHLKISTPGQEDSCRYRRSIVDYALISLRIAIERNALTKLTTLSLLDIHPSAIHYLNPLSGYGSRPNSPKRWKQITRLVINMQSYAYDHTLVDGAGPDHLKHLHYYLSTFSSTITHLEFSWLGAKGLFPLSLSSESLLQPSSPKTACPTRCHLALRPLKFDRLIYMTASNLITDSSQISSFITTHRRSISEFSFSTTSLREGSWDDALEPLNRMRSKTGWSERPEKEIMEVPLMLSPPSMEELAEEVKASVRRKQDEKREREREARCATPLIDILGSGAGGLWGEELGRNWDLGMGYGSGGKGVMGRTGDLMRCGLGRWLGRGRVRW